MEGLVLLSYIDPAWVVLVGRSVSVVVSTLTLLVIFLLGKAINISQTGLLLAYSENEIENTQPSEATIRDADVAAEVTEFSRAQILL